LKGVELAAQKLLTRDPRDASFKLRVRHKPVKFVSSEMQRCRSLHSHQVSKYP
jgi:hypothetical protein